VQGIGQIIREIGELVPWPVLVLLVAALIAVGAPGYLHAVRLRQIRERVRRRVRADAADRDRLADEAIRLAGDNVDALVLLCREASRRGQPDLLQRAMVGLEATRDRKAIDKLFSEIKRPAPTERSPTEVAVFITGLLDEGLTDVAAKNLEQALARHPGHPALLTLAERLPPPPPADGQPS
jgi:uncharacterized protein HemY